MGVVMSVALIFCYFFTCLLEILKAGPSKDRSKSTELLLVERPRQTALFVIRNSTTFPLNRAKSVTPNSEI